MSRLEERFEAPVLEAYGMSEASHQMSSNPLPPGSRKAGTVGKGTGVEIAILDSHGNFVEKGEVCVKGANVISHYHDNPKADQENFTDGWFRTGDQGYLDNDGYLTLTGRIKEIINRGGEKISPLEIDNVLLQHENVMEAITFGIKDEKYGEEVNAVVVLRTELPDMEKNILEFCKKSLVDFKCPKKIYFVKEIPKSPTGKIQRRMMESIFLNR
eukprot:TRINITY_DN1341_c0_g2_i4.p2 TRINITY_DN1341_c0_g2~~TRINITY_DN1341_c0_g2_i4.p2  ORF type:complete len:214 (-),score=53.60 TRINITY_DN1341_c0_g2_i4:29-670(-)